MNSIEDILNMVCTEATGQLHDAEPPTNKVAHGPWPDSFTITPADWEAARERLINAPIPRYEDDMPRLSDFVPIPATYDPLLRNCRRPIIIDHGSFLQKRKHTAAKIRKHRRSASGYRFGAR